MWGRKLKISKQVKNERTRFSEIGGGTIEVVTENEVVKEVILGEDGKMSIPSLLLNSEDALSSISSKTKLMISGVDGSTIWLLFIILISIDGSK